MTTILFLILFLTNTATLYALKRLIKLYNESFVKLEQEVKWVSLELRALQ